MCTQKYLCILTNKRCVHVCSSERNTVGPATKERRGDIERWVSRRSSPVSKENRRGLSTAIKSTVGRGLSNIICLLDSGTELSFKSLAWYFAYYFWHVLSFFKNYNLKRLFYYWDAFLFFLKRKMQNMAKTLLIFSIINFKMDFS